MGWVVALVVLFILSVLPFGLLITIIDEAPSVYLLMGPVKLTVFPSDGRGKPKREKKRQPTGSSRTSSVVKTKKKFDLISFLPIAEVIIDFLNGFRRKLRINDLQFKIVLSGVDPCDLAINYGRTWAVFSNLDPLLEQCFVIKRKCVEIDCDFLADKTIYSFKLNIAITLGRIIHLLLWHGTKIIKELLKLRNLRKAV